jgi:NAD(P)-dependent dehydrogenase (short-subunit alcohol dehydrogenase family)
MGEIGTQLDQQFYLGRMGMREMWNKTWDVNTTGTYILTHTLAPLLLKSSDPRLVFVTSGLSTLTEHENPMIPLNKSPGKGWPKEGYAVAAYRSSKTGMNMMMREWSRILKEDGVKVWCISPGFLATGLGSDAETNKKMGAEDPMLGANFVRDVIEGAWDRDVGKVIRRSGVQPW